MTFLTPIYLLALIPWGLLAAWVFLGRPPHFEVPFLPLWRGLPILARDHRRAIHHPPISIILLLCALFLSIIAAASPASRWRIADPGPFNLIIDRGLSMSAKTDAGQYRFALAARSAIERIHSIAPDAKIDILTVPPIKESIDSNHISSIAPTAADTSAGLARAILAAGAQRASVVVATDQSISIQGKFQIISPQAPIINVGIAGFSVRADPRPAAMVTVLNQSDARSAELKMTSDGRDQSINVTLPPRNTAANYFIDLPVVPRVVSVAIAAGHDELTMDQYAWMVRGSAWPVVKAVDTLPKSLQRLLDIYARQRPPGAESKSIAVTSGVGHIPFGEASAMVPPQTDTRVPIQADSVRTIDFPLDLHDLDWQRISKMASVAPSPGDGWSAIVFASSQNSAAGPSTAPSAPAQTLIAIQTTPLRRVWVGIDGAEFERSSDYVLLWSKIFAWLGEGGAQYRARAPENLSAHWRRTTPSMPPVPAQDNGLLPGIYSSDDGAILAINAWARKFNNSSATRPANSLNGIELTRPKYEFATPTYLIALSAVVIAGLCWPARGRPV